MLLGYAIAIAVTVGLTIISVVSNDIDEPLQLKIEEIAFAFAILSVIYNYHCPSFTSLNQFHSYIAYTHVVCMI
jgi:hypothetical protein